MYQSIQHYITIAACRLLFIGVWWTCKGIINRVMKVVILGASSKKSIGYHVGEHLVAAGHKVVYASRSGKLGLRCDSTNPRQIFGLLKKEKPSVVINAAGVFLPSVRLGLARDWKKTEQHLLAKSLGALVVLDAAIAVKGITHFIALGGREISGDPGFAAYTAGNGSLWALVRFAAKHTRIKTYFIDMPTIEGSTMESKHLQRMRLTGSRVSVKAEVVTNAVVEILSGKHESGSRIILGKRGGH